MAETALTQCLLNRVIWVPSRCPPHKSATLMSSLAHREEMVRRAIADNPAFVLESSQADPTGETYAIDTLKHLQVLYPNTHWYWIVGLDSFQTLPRWYRRQELIPACDWLVAPRLDPSQIDFLCQQVERKLEYQSIQIRWSILSMPAVGISSSLIRDRCRQQQSIRYLVPEAVRNYITEQKLYTSDRPLI